MPCAADRLLKPPMDIVMGVEPICESTPEGIVVLLKVVENPSAALRDDE